MAGLESIQQPSKWNVINDRNCEKKNVSKLNLKILGSLWLTCVCWEQSYGQKTEQRTEGRDNEEGVVTGRTAQRRRPRRCDDQLRKRMASRCDVAIFIYYSLSYYYYYQSNVARFIYFQLLSFITISLSKTNFLSKYQCLCKDIKTVKSFQ